ncbi:single-stranded-DNA-specific exonuclease RecJ [Arcobacteraceae bacterium]|nr:single-stranded-DNA-specific exonuclease RecJ [Arcobacteraceae bacterium]
MNKELTISDIDKILSSRIQDDAFKTLKSIPTPNKFKDMSKATNRIIQAIENDEVINLVGDYDVDGVTSTSIMVTFFSALGIEINHIIPNRFEHGYGLSPIILEQIYDGIIITVDNGISAVEAANICKQRGLDLIITDHHTVGDILPNAFAIVNPKQENCPFPFKEICGAQIAWYLCASIKKALNFEYNLMELFDLLSLAIVADIMPMVSLNKTMVKAGLKALASSTRPAIVALRQRYNLVDVTEEDIGFKIAPLINCAGRMADPSIALEFLLSYDEFEANMQLDYLIELNESRKEDQLKMFNEAKGQVDTSLPVVVVASENWNEGIVGIVASKLCEKYKKPSIVFSINNDVAKASCRSTSSVNLYELIKTCSSLLNGFGGHKQAAGLSIQTNKLEEFTRQINKNITVLPKLAEDKSTHSLGLFNISNVSSSVYELIESYRPFGITNPYPILTFLDVEVLNIIKMGKNKEFTKLTVGDTFQSIEVVIFVDFEGVEIEDKISFNATISKNEFRGEIKFNLMFKELL